MPAVAKVPLGTATLVRKWYCDVNTNTYASPTWAGLFGMTDFKFVLDPVMKDDSDLDSSGWKSESATAMGWSVETKVERKVVEGAITTYNPAQEFLRGKALLIGSLNHVDIRFYEMTDSGPRVEAYRGYANVQWKPDGGGMEDHDTVTITLSGQGALTAITHPDDSAAVPVVTGISPAGGATAGGTLCKVTGSGFTLLGVDDVVGLVFAAEPAVTWVTENDNVLWVVAPAHAGGSVEVKVENAEGTSTTHADFLYA